MNMIERAVGQPLTDKQASLILQWVLHLSNFRSVGPALGIDRKQVTQLRKKLLSNTDLVHLKLEVLRHVVGETSYSSIGRHLSTMFGRDMERVWNKFVRQPMFVTLESRLVLKSIEDIPTFVQLNKECNKAFAESKMIKQAMWLSNSKMRFLQTSNNFAAHDYASALLGKAVEVYYHYRPMKSSAYAVNAAKSAMHHTCINNIVEQTSEDNSRLITTDLGWENRIISLDHDTVAVAATKSMSSSIQFVPKNAIELKVWGAYHGIEPYASEYLTHAKAERTAESAVEKWLSLPLSVVKEQCGDLFEHMVR